MKTLKILTLIVAFLFIGSAATMAQSAKKKVTKKTATVKTKGNNNIKSTGAPVPGQEITTEQEVQKNKGKGKNAKKSSKNKKATKNK